MIEYTLVRSRRKTVAIHITKEAAVEVRAPMRMPKADIERFVLSKEKWIASNRLKRERIISARAAALLNYGDTASLCGKACPIRAGEGLRAGFDGECFFIPPCLPPGAVRQAVIRIYRLVAKQILSEKAAAYARRMGVTPAAVKINGAKTRWGSCSGKNSVNFSWRLVMADEGVVDYVVVHELAHIKEHNHSPRFWAVVADILPDYELRVRELRAFQERLSAENWD